MVFCLFSIGKYNTCAKVQFFPLISFETTKKYVPLHLKNTI
ncbi:hypothetical protein CAPGI0001_1884 [Capnocytophaga gingivalis ATCC 33624]|nr:hypothetical protein CAPGI0001_1884 [Capnocytophaga gingivalis ATCC 33624]